MKIKQPECEHCSGRSSSLFHFCHLQELKKMEEVKTCSLYKSGQAIFYEGAKPIGLYCINSGKVKVSKTASDGKEQIVRLAKAGDFLGYCSLLSGQPYSTFATAIENTVVCLVPKNTFIQLLNSNRQFSDHLMKLLCDNITASAGKMAAIAYKPVRGRIAEALLFLNTFYRTDTSPEGLISITREDLAAFVGTVKETAIRTLKELKQEKIIETSRAGITIKNQPALLKVSELYD